jgi:hypothetical protein
MRKTLKTVLTTALGLIVAYGIIELARYAYTRITDPMNQAK